MMTIDHRCISNYVPRIPIATSICTMRNFLQYKNFYTRYDTYLISYDTNNYDYNDVIIIN